MFGEIFQVIMNHPMLVVVFVLDVFLILAILFFVFGKIYKTKRPDRIIKFLLKKFAIRHKISSPTKIEDLYAMVIDAYTSKGLVTINAGKNYRARKQILEKLSGSEYNVVKSIFDGYEMKRYGGGLNEEQRVVSYLLNQFRSL
jgi:hypothetical protein